MKTILSAIMAALLLASFLSAPALAQTTVTCEQEYTVATGDWLSTLAEKYFGSVTGYYALATQTNLKSETDVSFATVTNPDSIEVGWKLCVPDAETASAINGDNPPAGLDKEALGNATYSSELMPDGKATLENGTYSVNVEPGTPVQAQMTLTDQIAYGDLNGVPSAAVITGSTGGGTGYFYILSLMQVQDGKPVEVAVTGIGDRSPVLALIIENNQILADYLTQGPEQPFCCGTLRVVETYGLDGTTLNSISKKELGYLGPNGETPGQPLAVTGDVFYRERIAMPEGAVVTVRVEDVSKQDVAAELIGEQVIENPGNVPVKFSVPYDSSKIQPGNTYAVRARIEVDGQLMWLNTLQIPVITNGNPTSGVQVLVQRVGTTAPAEPTTTPDAQATSTPDTQPTTAATTAPTTAPTTAATRTPTVNPTAAPTTAPTEESLTGVVWEWQGTTSPTRAVKVNDPSRYTVEFNEDGTASIKNDCNQMGAAYKVDGQALTIMLGPSTLVACPADSQDVEFTAQLSSVATYSFEDGTLLLDLLADAGTMRFEQ